MKKKTLFITTKNLDYLRNIQEINLLKAQNQEVKVIGSSSNQYIKRLLVVYIGLFFQRIKEYDTIFIGFAPQLVLPFWWWKFRGKQIKIDFFISMYDTLVFDRKKFKKNSLIGKILKYLDRRTLFLAEEIICDTKEHGKYFVTEFGAPFERMHTLYLEADTTIYYPRERKKAGDFFEVLYFGSILPLQGVDIVLKSAQILQKNTAIHFTLIGPIKEGDGKVESDTITYIPWLSQEQLAEAIAQADLCLAGHFNKDINKAKRTIPGKAYIYRAMEKPMILGDNSATRELYSEDMDGIYFVEMGNPQALAKKILKIKEEYFIKTSNITNDKSKDFVE